MFGCPPVCLDASICLDTPIYLDAPPVCLDAPICLDKPLYVWMPPICLDTPVCLGTPVWMPPVCLEDVWMPALHIQQKESMLCQTEGVSICPHTFGCPLYIWTPPYVWMFLIPFDAHTLGGIQTYRGQPNIWRTFKHTGGDQTCWASDNTEQCPNIGSTQTCKGHPNIWVSANIQVGIQAYGGFQTYGGIQTYRGHPNIWEHPNIQGVHLNIWQHLHIQGASKWMGAYGHPLSLAKRAFFVFCM